MISAFVILEDNGSSMAYNHYIVSGYTSVRLIELVASVLDIVTVDLTVCGLPFSGDQPYPFYPCRSCLC